MTYSIENYVCTTSEITRLELELFSHLTTTNLLDYFDLHVVKNNLTKYGSSIAEINDTLLDHIHKCQ